MHLYSYISLLWVHAPSTHLESVEFTMLMLTFVLGKSSESAVTPVISSVKMIPKENTSAYTHTHK